MNKQGDILPVFIPDTKKYIKDFVWGYWEGVEYEYLLKLLNIDQHVSEERLSRAIKELEKEGLIRYDKRGLLRKGCDIHNEKYKDKVKVFKVRSSECGQWIVCNTYEEAVTVARDELSMFDLDHFDGPFSARVEIQVSWLSIEEYDSLKEHDGC